MAKKMRGGKAFSGGKVGGIKTSMKDRVMSRKR